MYTLSGALVALAIASLAHAQGVLVDSVGDTGIGSSVSLAVEIENTADANYIAQDEIVRNVVNACGRTLLAGDISQSGETEKVIASGHYTLVTKGGSLNITVAQRTSAGTGPFTCDLDEYSNVYGVSGQTNLTVTQDSSQFGTGNLTLSVAMPTNLTCIGGSTGNFCTVRCVNAQNFGGCLAVAQSDTANNINDASTIQSAELADDIDAQIKQNQADLAAANEGLAEADTSDQALKVANAILGASSAVDTGTAAAAATAAGAKAAQSGSATVTVTVTVTAAQANAAAVGAAAATDASSATAAASSDSTGTATSTRRRRTRTRTGSRTRTRTRTRTNTTATATSDTATTSSA